MTVIPYDEDEIVSQDNIIRRINPTHHIVWDNNRDCKRVSTKAFSPSSEENGGMSVDIEKLIIDGEDEPREYVTTPDFTCSVTFSAQNIRYLGLRIGYDPLAENPYHGEVWGKEARPNRFSKKQKRGLLAASKWFVEPADPVELG